ncbi:rhomboid family intramembrane serine protease [soil metagenome]
MEEPAAARSPATVVNAILAANVIVFLLWQWPGVSTAVMAEHFLISWAHLAAGHVWTLVTAVFSHNALVHLFVNMIVLVSFGPALERVMGSGRFVLFYLLAGATGSLAHAVVSNFLIGSPAQAALGASSALAGVLLFFSLAYPKARVLFFFVIPVPALVAALLFVGLDIWGLTMQIEGGGLPIGHGAHLGGALTGMLYYIAFRRRLHLHGPGAARHA